MDVIRRCPTSLIYVLPGTVQPQHHCDFDEGHEGAHHCPDCGLVWTGLDIKPDPTGKS